MVFFPCASVAVADVLVLKDGSRIDGKLQGCDEERCTVGGRKVALDQIARIELRSGVAVPSAAGAGSIVLTDGTLRSTHFSGLNLGVVYTDGGEIDRGEVAVIILAGLLPVPGRSPAVPNDLLILADGAKRVGRLTTCTAASCTFESHLVPLDTIRWIGLKGEGTEPPPGSATEDQIFVKDEPPVAARMSLIDATTVRTTRGNFARNDVTWIHVTPPLDETPKKGAEKAGERGNDKGGDKPPPPPPPKKTPPPSGKQSPPPKGPRFGDLADGDLWTGTIDGEQTVTTVTPPPPQSAGVHHYTTHMEVRLREHNKRPIIGAALKLPHAERTVGWEVDLWNEGTRVEASFDDGRCSDRATTTYSDDEIGHHIWWRTIADDDVTSLIPFTIMNMKFEDVPMDGVYWLQMGTKTSTWDPCALNWTNPLPYALAQDLVDIGMGDGPNSEYRGVLDPPRNHHLNAAHTRMTGAFDLTTPLNDGSGSIHLKVCWDICKKGSGACGAGCGAPPPTSTPPVEKCPSTLKADSDLETNRIKKSAKIKEMAEHAVAAGEHKKEAMAHYDDFRKVVIACGIQSLATNALIALLAPEVEGAGATKDVIEALEFCEKHGLLTPSSFQLLAKIAEKLAKGEDPTTALLPEELQVVQETLAGMELVKGAFEGASAAQMEKSLEECGGAFLVSTETKLSAQKGVEAFKAQLEEETEMQKLTNDIRGLDVVYPDLQYKAWEACVQRARCLGTPESACAGKKPPGNWPDVP
jgi:hypothetical protein